jgi:hypothetical protein
MPLIAKARLLEESADYSDVVRYLVNDAGLTVKELAELIQVDQRTVRRWVKDEGSPSERAYTAIDEVRHLARLLGPSLPGHSLGRWLRAKNRYLGGRRAIDLMMQGNYDVV